MRINIWIVLLVVLLIASISFFVGKYKYEVVDSEGKYVKGKFISTDGITATLKS